MPNTFLPKMAVVFCAFALPAFALSGSGPNVTTWRYDISRTGQNLTETVLTPANVNATSFGKLFSYAVDGSVYAQPLYMGGLNVGGGTHNVVFVATEHDSVFAFDADQNQLLWKVSLIDAAHGAASGASTVVSSDVGTSDIVPEIGITSTPVIDPTTNTLYVVAKSKENNVFIQRLHALDLATGNEKSGSPVVIHGSVPGNGNGSLGGNVAFQAQWELNRVGLLLLNNHVYVAFGAHGDNGPYHGWVFAFDATTLQQTGIFNSTPNGNASGIWESGAGLAADTVNGGPRMFFSTGNGASNVSVPYTNSENYGDAIVRLDLSNGGLQASDQWTPFDQQQLSSGDADQGSGGVLLLPDQSGGHVHELIQVGKNGRIEVLDRDNLGGYNTSSNNIVQEIRGQVGGLWSTPAYWNGNVYFWGSNDSLKQFSITNGLLSGSPISTGTIGSSFPGPSAVITSNGVNNGVLWAIRSEGYNAGSPSILYAFDPTNVSKLLYSSAQNSARDAAGKAVKFAVPMISNGKVYVNTLGEVDVYGELASAPPTVPTPTFSPVAGVYPSAQMVTLSDSLAGSTIHYTTDGTTPTAASNVYGAPITVSTTTTIRAIATAPNDNASGVASGTFTIGASPVINFSNGFASTAGLTLNGSAVHSDDSRLQLTTGATTQAGSAFSNTAVNVQSFSTDFNFQLSGAAPLADGITFTLQNSAPTALGPTGGGLGYGPDLPTGTGGIPLSVAVKFDLYSNNGEGTDSTGVYANGASPTTPAVDLTGSGIVLTSGDTFSAHVTYDGATLYLTLKDPVNGAIYAHSFPINIPRITGNTAFVGFTGGTGGLTASQKILTWIFASNPSFTPIIFETETLHGVSSGPVFRTFAWGGFPDGSGTILDATKAGDSVSFTANVPQAGTYDLHVSSKSYFTRGIWQLSVDGVNVGTPQDEYNATEKLVDSDLGPVAFKVGGNHVFKFVVTGRNPSSSDSKISFDALKFIPR